jgi:hypothetical protein
MVSRPPTSLSQKSQTKPQDVKLDASPLISGSQLHRDASSLLFLDTKLLHGDVTLFLYIITCHGDATFFFN